MSLKVTNWVWARSESRNGARLVMLALADRADDNGRCWPSIDDIADRTRLTPRAVRKALTDLVKLGELEVEGGGGRARTNRYRIIPKPGTLDRVTSGKPGTLDRVSGKETLNSATETLNFETENPELCDRNPEQSSPEPIKNHQGNRQENHPPTPRAEPSLADRMADEFMNRYRRGNSYRRSTVRDVIAGSLDNEADPDELWCALELLGKNSSTVTANSLQVAFSKLRNPRDWRSNAANVVQLPTGQQLTGTDAKVAGWAAVAAQLAEQGDSA